VPRLTGSHSTYETVLEQLNGVCTGYFLFGQNPAVASANARMQRMGMANLDWLVVRGLRERKVTAARRSQQSDRRK
jgi:formate dehydrogenase major subunit